MQHFTASTLNFSPALFQKVPRTRKTQSMIVRTSRTALVGLYPCSIHFASFANKSLAIDWGWAEGRDPASGRDFLGGHDFPFKGGTMNYPRKMIRLSQHALHFMSNKIWRNISGLSPADRFLS